MIKIRKKNVEETVNEEVSLVQAAVIVVEGTSDKVNYNNVFSCFKYTVFAPVR